VLEALMARTMRRSRVLALRLVVNQLVRLEDRLMITMWGLAERFGRVTPDGVILPLELTHSTLARLVGARRPSVTSALGVLSREGFVERTEHGWLLHGSPSDVLEPLGERLTAPA
jgi:CRP-like cAMP-binding protein